MTREHIHFVTGRLAERALRDVLRDLEPNTQFEYSVGVLPITVAALMTPRWIARNLNPPEEATHVLVPGYCAGELDVIEEATGKVVQRGPRDLRQLPEYFGGAAGAVDMNRYDIEIIAEINHAPRLALDDILAEAKQLAAAGADLIDVGCDPGETWSGVAECVTALRGEGHRVSIDSFDHREIVAATAAGAELVLSVNSGNRIAAPDWGCEVVAIPDEPTELDQLEETVAFLAAQHVAFRLDPILEPIGCGFAASMGRYLRTRRRFPDDPIMMGIGNLSELTDVDSAGINFLLLGFCQELQIRSVLTTQVINWARTSVQECQIARALVHHAVQNQYPPKNLSRQLVLLRDAKLHEHGPAVMEQLAGQIKDHNIRIFAEGERLHLVSGGVRIEGSDPFELFARLEQEETIALDRSHAFYLGYELAMAATALTLGKQYEQDEPLDWGFLTVKQQHHRLPRRRSGP